MKILGPGLPGPKFAHPLMMKLFKRGTVKSAHGHGIGRHSEEEVKKIALADLKVCLKNILYRTALNGSSQVVWNQVRKLRFVYLLQAGERNFLTPYSHNPGGAFYCSPVQSSAKRRVPGFMNFVPVIANYSCLALPAAFTQPGHEDRKKLVLRYKVKQSVGLQLTEILMFVYWQSIIILNNGWGL